MQLFTVTTMRLLLHSLFLCLAPCTVTAVNKKVAAQRLMDALQAVAAGTADRVDVDALDAEIYAVMGDNRMLKDRPFYGDRYVQNMLDIVHDPDCMTGSLDATAADFSVERAIQVLTKCGLLLVKNAVPREILEPFKLNVTSYMHGLMNGRIASDGKTTYGEPYFIHETSHHRYDMLFPESLFNEDSMAHPLILDIVSDERVIG